MLLQKAVRVFSFEIKSSFGATRIDEGILPLGGVVEEAVSPRLEPLPSVLEREIPLKLVVVKPSAMLYRFNGDNEAAEIGEIDDVSPRISCGGVTLDSMVAPTEDADVLESVPRCAKELTSFMGLKRVDFVAASFPTT